MKKDYDAVKAFREIKERISKDIKGMTYDELMKYFERTQLRKNTPEV